MRCFVAIDLSPDVRAALEDECERLRAVAPRADVRGGGPAGRPLPLTFWGGGREERRPRTGAARAAAPAAPPPIALACAGLGMFPGPSKPRVVWAGITDGLRELGLLAAAVER